MLISNKLHSFRNFKVQSYRFCDPSSAKQLTMHINGIEGNGEATAIWSVIGDDDDDAEIAAKGIYSLSGQKMNATDTRSLPKGIYIVNGKKTIIK